MNRLSVWGSSSSPTPSSPTKESEQPINSDPSVTTNKPAAVRGLRSIDGTDAAPPSLQPQTTGGLWSSWWTSSGGADKAQKQTPKWYVDGLKGSSVDMRLVKHLISLRVHLSTASLIWIEEFVQERRGIAALATLLAGLVGKNGKRKVLTEVESTVLFELIKCLRVLLNTEVRCTHYQRASADVLLVGISRSHFVSDYDYPRFLFVARE
jgi:diaphanous 1